MKKIKGIPTLYGGVEYRSRLEAKWACFFDLCGWRYQYEPYDLNGWIPDFALYGYKEILVEVKPYSSLDEFDCQKYIMAKSQTEKDQSEILLLGSRIHEKSCFDDSASIGWLSQFVPDDEKNSDWFALAVMNKWDGVYGFIHEYGTWEDRITGLYDGDHWLNIPPYSEINHLWGRAGNAVKWLPKGGDR